MENYLLENLSELLKTNVVTVTFTKVNGDTRIMKCTQNYALIPSEKYPVQESLPSAKNDSIERVFDLNIQDWRSFRKNSVTEFKV